MGVTRTGGFTIGFRRMGSKWQQDLGALIGWAKENGFGAMDLGNNADELAKRTVDAGVRIGSVDLPEWLGMISPDPGKRADAFARNAEYVRTCAAAGEMNHFVVMLPEKADLPRAQNFDYMVESYNELAPVLEECSARLVIEGWPGPGCLVCNPEGYRAFFEQCSSIAMGVNYDPSHLIRMGIAPIDFLREFADRVYHIHGKDTEILTEELYEFGNALPRIYGNNPGFGSTYWRYTIPGHGEMRWTEAFKILADAGYDGCVSVELEDGNFNGSEATEKQGLILALRYLEGC